MLSFPLYRLVNRGTGNQALVSLMQREGRTSSVLKIFSLVSQEARLAPRPAPGLRGGHAMNSPGGHLNVSLLGCEGILGGCLDSAGLADTGVFLLTVLHITGHLPQGPATFG